jgi:hypothetical protein
MINWKRHAKVYYKNWKYCSDLADAHYGRYRKWQDRAKRAEAEVDRLTEAYNDLLGNYKSACDELSSNHD